MSESKSKRTAPPPFFRTTEQGLYQIETNEDGTESPHKISPPIFIDALTHDSSGENYGHLVRFQNQSGQERNCILLYSELFEGKEAIQRVFNLGFKASERRRDVDALRHYILQSNPSTTICAVPSHGWHSGTFIDNDEYDLNNGNHAMILDPNVATGHRYRTSGTLEEWQANVGRLCQGNTRLALAISAAFAGPLLQLLKAPNIGLHFRGISSIGKTTALYVAGSVWGGGGGEDNNLGFIQSWRATANGLELQCALHNDAILCLDEISLASEKEVGDIVYCLGNGIGKRRATRDIRSRPVIQFRLVFLSCGERSLKEMMAAAGKRTKGGQESRLIDIPADAGHERGIFETLHGHRTGAELANRLMQASKTYYGTPSRAWTASLMQNPAEAAAEAKERREHFVQKLKLEENQASGEAYRIADAIGLIAAAGEMATDRGCTGWDPEEHLATAAANIGIYQWRHDHGGFGAHDIRAGMKAVRHFLLRFPYRFQNLKNPDSFPPHDRAGFFEQDEGKDYRRYLIIREVFEQEICQDYDPQLIVEALQKHEFLVENEEGRKFTYHKKIPGEGFGRFYCVLSTICDFS